MDFEHGSLKRTTSEKLHDRRRTTDVDQIMRHSSTRVLTVSGRETLANHFQVCACEYSMEDINICPGLKSLAAREHEGDLVVFG
ncbi:hypothetical protein HAX54_002247, partial [Datura stramonium]|nr:hypothetical protein [Datura stramonium]